MTDIVDRKTRSRMMAGIRAQDTKPERVVASLLHREGLRFRKNVRGMQGTPDLVFPKFQSCIFVHGCFWHLHDCTDFVWPKSNRKFWRSKLESNRRRDEANLKALRKAGWRCRVVWECETRKCSVNRRAKRFAVGLANWVRRGER